MEAFVSGLAASGDGASIQKILLGGPGNARNETSASPPRILLDTGSFSGYRPALALGSGYLSATDNLKQPLCGNEEGWGPLSPFRYDFTPCFIDVWVAAVAVFGIVVGSLALWWLLKRKPSSSVPKSLQFWAKQVSKVHDGRRNRTFLVREPRARAPV